MTKQDALEKLGYSNLRYDKQENKISAEDSSSPVTRGIASRNKDKLSQLYSNINVQPTNSQPASKSMRKAKNPSVSSAQPQVNTSSKSPQTNVEKKLDYLYSQGNIAPIQSNKPKTVQIKPPVQKSSMSSILISFLIFGAIGILAIVFFILLLAINVPQSQSTSTPKPQLVATLRDEPTLSVIYATAIEKNECMRWTQVKSVHEGKQICVYGSVINKKTIRTDNDSWFLIRFDIDTTTFYIISDKILQVKIGDCIIAESVINYDINKVPYMKVDEVVIEDNRCVN
jgi:hypothetical protein